MNLLYNKTHWSNDQNDLVNIVNTYYKPYEATCGGHMDISKI